MAEPPRAHPYGRSAEDVRRRVQRTRRTRRVRITQLIVFAALALTLIGVAVYALGELRQPVADPGVIEPKTFGSAPAELTCPEPDAVPLPPEEVSVHVLNGTTRTGLAGEVSTELAERGYDVGDPGDTTRDSGPVTIVHGPDGYLAAQSVGAQYGQAQLRMDEREDSTVDVLLGEGYTGLAEESAAQEALGAPVPVPEGC